MVLPTGISVDDLNPTIRLMHERLAKDVAEWRTALALCRVQSDAEEVFARDYLKRANYAALPGSPRERKAFRDVQNLGQAITEGSPHAREARALIEAIGQALSRATLQCGQPWGLDGGCHCGRGVAGALRRARPAQGGRTAVGRCGMHAAPDHGDHRPSQLERG